ncbi:hypothetical protein Ahy_A10g048167 isoform A [Arachis hypogaea]|uniref:U-box domain-containing protein n=1 Tax=Arachis hypogaea TaxID=3818 RepID=A0A445B4G5_ARAHY|nr:hypothetical protein Ahy_A10g048167 isoform A [Arachis hypogaea]
MKPHQPKLKTQLFSCGFFRHCAQTVLSPTGPPPPPPPPPPLPPHNLRNSCESSTSSSSSATSQSFTQWRFSLPTTPSTTTTTTPPPPQQPPPTPPPLLLPNNLEELFHLSELQLTTGSESDRAAAIHLLERSLVPNPPQDQPPCPPALLRHVIRHLTATTKILFALCLSPSNRRLADLDGAPAERALAALELMCTVAEGAEAVRAHALAVPVMVTMMGRTGARGKEYAIGVLAVVYGGSAAAERETAAPPEEVARAVELALQGECSARGRRKGSQLLKTLQLLSDSNYESPHSHINNEDQPT